MTLSNHHRETVEKILAHGASGNIEWRQVLSLFEAIGDVTEEHNGNFKVTIGPETETLHRPHEKDIDEQMIVDLRRMLTQAGYGEPGAVEDSRDRNYGDDRWGKPE
jgi:rubrerythrin